MTLTKLIARLTELEQMGAGRCPVNIFLNSLDTGNQTFNCCDIERAEIEVIGVCDGDGFHIENRDGSERMRKVLMLRGRWWDDKADMTGPRYDTAEVEATIADLQAVERGDEKPESKDRDQRTRAGQLWRLIESIWLSPRKPWFLRTWEINPKHNGGVEGWVSLHKRGLPDCPFAFIHEDEAKELIEAAAPEEVF